VTLRRRLALTLVGVVVPFVVALLWLDGRARHRAASELLAEATFGQMLHPGERARCEASAATWGGRRPPPDEPPPRRADDDEPHGAPPIYYAYDHDLRAANPAAPTISALEAGDVTVIEHPWWSEDIEVVVRMPWTDGPCAVIYAHGTTVRGWIGAIVPASPLWLVPVGGVFVALLLAIGPVVRRTRRLTAAVRRSAASGFADDVAIPVEGRDEITELARAFAAAGSEVRTQLAARDDRERALREFLANTTHDVMIPLTVLQAHLSSLREAPDSKILAQAMDEAHYIGALLHNLAMAAKLDAAAPELLRGPVDLNALVARVIGRHRPIARELAIDLEAATPEQPLVTEADVTMLEQAVSNVVYNAIRHNRRGGHVAVILEAPARDRFRLRVVDDGPGIAADELSRLVERGFRGGDARTRTPDGQGLGLHITWRVARLHELELTFAPSSYGGLQVDLEGPAHA
jgi:two-component system, OmpR family, sensor histidine kinase BaeS